MSHADRGAEMARRIRSLDQHMEERGRAEAEDEIYTDRSLSEKGTRGDGASRGPMWERASYLCINELAVSACLFRSWPFRLCPNLHRGMRVYSRKLRVRMRGSPAPLIAYACSQKLSIYKCREHCVHSVHDLPTQGTNPSSLMRKLNQDFIFPSQFALD